MMKSGAAFSGHERNCAFLNQRDGTFATVSAISGLDFPDDGRAAAHLDWDGDGDLDLWVANRSAPQLRFLRNDLAGQNRSLAVQLEGRTCNRDAIGARLELYLEGRAAPLVRTLRAGGGFLAQSSKWVHFGLGQASGIDRLLVRWPGGAAEEIRDLQPDGRYRIVQGMGAPQRVPARTVRLVATDPPLEANVSAVAQVLSHSLIPLPALAYRDWDGNSSQVFTGNPRQPGQPVLLNLWASWCAPCIAELGAFSKQHAAIQRAGLRVVGLSVDGVGSDGDLTAAKRLADNLGLPFATGVADAKLVEKIQLVHDMAFEFHQELPVPCSILIDSQGRMSAIYKGPVTVDQILADVARFGLDSDGRRAASLPFPGRWFAPSRPLHLFNLAWRLFEHGFFNEGMAFYVDNAAHIKGHPNHPELLLTIGDGCLRDGRRDLAVRMFEEALHERPGWVEARQRLDHIAAGGTGRGR
ncbi:hypothetical protein BH23VER1_BH23VER1_08140 [soil metagenome]